LAEVHRVEGVYVGTSGWVYDWNQGGDFRWYARYSRLNAVELNASFYRFPYPSQVASWARRGSGLRWSVKVHRSITHYSRLGAKALEIWDRFKALFKPLEPYIDFYLFQLPPSYRCDGRGVSRLRDFAASVNLGRRFAVEFRHPSCFTRGLAELCRELGVTMVSVDSPEARWLVNTSGWLYLRMHGRDVWYAYEYSPEELEEVAQSILRIESPPERIYVFFNNNHWMLENARYMLLLLKKLFT